MMGIGHALSGLAVGLGTAGLAGPSPVERAGWVIAVTGCSLLPDLDATGTTVSRMWGPISNGLRVKVWGRSRKLVPGITDLVGTIAGGHRRGTHSVLGLLAVLVLVWVASWSRLGTGLVLAVATGLGIAAACVIVPGRGPASHWQVNLAASVLVAVVLVQRGTVLPGWVPFAMALGAAVHILGDMITRQGCPLSWPTETKRVSLLPLEAGGLVERIVIYPVLCVWIVVSAAWALGYDPVGATLHALTTWRGL